MSNCETVIALESAGTVLSNERITVQLIGGSTLGPRGRSAYEVAVEGGFIGTEADWLASLVGPVGPVGPSADFTTKNAGETLSGHKVVILGQNDEAYTATNVTTSHAFVILGITKGAASAGQPVEVQVSGYMTDPSFNFSVGPLFVGENGALVQTPPASPAAFSMVIGYAISPTEISINKSTPLFFG